MSLAQKRVQFTVAIAKLILWAEERGKHLALDQVKRTQEEANKNAASGAGIKNSNHLIGLAADCILYEGPNYEWKSKSEDYKELGEYWKTLHPLARWGGDFKSRPDGNHFSFEHNGVQ